MTYFKTNFACTHVSHLLPFGLAQPASLLHFNRHSGTNQALSSWTQFNKVVNVCHRFVMQLYNQVFSMNAINLHQCLFLIRCQGTHEFDNKSLLSQSKYKLRADHLPTNVKNLVHQSLSFLQCCEKIWCFYSKFFVLQFCRLKLAQGAIYLD